MKIDVLTLFPEMFEVITGASMLGRARDNGLLEVTATDIRDFTTDKHNRVDDTPFGGGAGMVMMVDPICRALQAVGAGGKPVLYMSPKGERLDREMIEELAGHDELVILCGHYEGIDERVLGRWDIREVSIGDYILTGGEPAAIVLIDAVARMIPGVLGDPESVLDESIYSGLLEYPQYTRPREYEGDEVPEILLSGDHEKIRLWRLERSLELTRDRRPDLLEKYRLERGGKLSKKEAEILRRVLAEPQKHD